MKNKPFLIMEKEISPKQRNKKCLLQPYMINKPFLTMGKKISSLLNELSVNFFNLHDK